jgi:hypothetical protein
VLGFVERFNPCSKAVGAECPLRFDVIVYDHVDPKNTAAVRAAIGNEASAELLTMGRFLL